MSITVTGGITIDNGSWTVTAAPPSTYKIYSWGNNVLGALGQNDTVNRSSPTQVGSLTTWSTVTSNGDFSYSNSGGVKGDGTAWVWGDNGQGELGQNDKVHRSSPIQVGALTTWSKMESGLQLYLAIKTDGSLWGWGNNSYGQLGQNNQVYRSSPVQIGADTTWANVISNYTSSAAIKTDGTLWTWGFNGSGNLGINNTTNKSSPTQVGTGTNWSKVVITSTTAMFAIKTDGTLWGWGNGSLGQLGLNSTIYRSSPTQIGASTNWATVGASRYGAIAIKTDGSLWTWGYNGFGQLGTNDIVYRSSPVQVGAGTTWLSVSVANYLNPLVTKTDGSLWSWGRNQDGQLGLNNTVNRSSPVQIGAATTWTKVSGGGYNMLAAAS